MSKKDMCATVFVHGFMGWGEDDAINSTFPYWGFLKNKDVMEHLRSEGWEVYSPSVGPVNSAWDRAVNLWYQLVGGTVDYGKVHSEKYGHERYGRTYPGLIKDWGKEGAHKQINLVGHSFGAPAVRYFAELVANGCQEEIDGTPEEELSELFKGGKADWIRSVSTLTGVNNGTTLASVLRKRGVLAINRLYLGVNTMLGNSFFVDKLIDFRMEQWGVMEAPDKRQKTGIRSPFAKHKEINNFCKNVRDSVGFEMQIEGMYDMNQFITCVPGIYYFAHPACRSDEKGKMDKEAGILAKVVGDFVTGPFESVRLQRYAYSLPEWKRQDGFVNTEGCKAPLHEPSDDLPADLSECKKGQWYNYPVEKMSHVSYMGMDLAKEPLFSYFDKLMDDLSKLPE